MKGLPAEEHSALELRLKGALCLEINIQRFTFRFIMTYLHPAILCPHILLSNRTLRTTPSKCTNATCPQVPCPLLPNAQQTLRGGPAAPAPWPLPSYSPAHRSSHEKSERVEKRSRRRCKEGCSYYDGTTKGHCMDSVLLQSCWRYVPPFLRTPNSFAIGLSIQCPLVVRVVVTAALLAASSTSFFNSFRLFMGT